MKKILVLIALSAMLAGCSDFTGNTYRTLRIAEITNVALIDSANDAYKNGLIDYEKRLQIESVDKIFQSTFKAAKEALLAYAVTDGDKELKQKVVNALVSVTRDLDNLQKIYIQLTEGIEGVKEWKQ